MGIADGIANGSAGYSTNNGTCGSVSALVTDNASGKGPGAGTDKRAGPGIGAACATAQGNSRNKSQEFDVDGFHDLGVMRFKGGE